MHIFLWSSYEPHGKMYKPLYQKTQTSAIALITHGNTQNNPLYTLTCLDDKVCCQNFEVHNITTNTDRKHSFLELSARQLDFQLCQLFITGYIIIL